MLKDKVAIEMAAGRGDQARKRFQDLVQANPEKLRAWQTLADQDTRLGALDASVVAQLRSTASIDRSQDRPHLALVERLLIIDDTKAALAAV